jgi:hypothetical protein
LLLGLPIRLARHGPWLPLLVALCRVRGPREHRPSYSELLARSQALGPLAAPRKLKASWSAEFRGTAVAQASSRDRRGEGAGILPLPARGGDC